mgnify:CR=1 FL=1
MLELCFFVSNNLFYFYVLNQINLIIVTIAIVGSRNFNNYKLLETIMSQYLLDVTQIVTGGAKGADQLGEKWCLDYLNQVPILIYPDWKNIFQPRAVIKSDKNGRKYDAMAGIRRNEKIVDQSDLVIAFWDGKSKGTQHVINYSRKQKKEVKVVLFEHNTQLELGF